MLRVISGSARNLLLKTPEGKNTRPTTDRIKETLFNMLQGDIYDSVVIDFFAGSGSIGIESLSRGARKAYFIDNSSEANKCICENVKHTHFEDKATIFNCDAIRGAMQIHESAVDIVFMDPPYEKGLEADLLSVLKNQDYVTEDTLFIVEADIKTDFSFADGLGYEIVREKLYKTNKHVFLKLKEA